MLAYLVDAFTHERFKGNRAGVVFDADQLSRLERQQIAAEIAAPESAFISRSNVADYKVEFFTPTTEVNFCGHATIATFYMLAAVGLRSFDSSGRIELTQETKAGILPISIQKEGEQIRVSMKQRKPQFALIDVAPSAVATALNIKPAQLNGELPVSLSNTGNWHLMIPVGSKAVLDAINYDREKLSRILSNMGAITAHVFCVGQNNEYFARNFCPTIGIPEDPATGAAAGAFAAYLAREKILTEPVNRIRIVQGEAMGRTSQIDVCVAIQDGEVQEVEVSGTATPSFVLSHYEDVANKPSACKVSS